MYAETEMPRWWTPHGVIISTEVWFVEIKGLVCKTLSLIELKYTAFHYVTTPFKCVIISRTEYKYLSKQSAVSVRKTAEFLSLNRISELVWDSESYEEGAPSDNSSEDDGGFEDGPGVSHLQT